MADPTPESTTPTYDALNVSDKAFVDALLAGKPQYVAYQEAIYSGDDPTYGYLARAASRKVRKGNIRQALSERYAEEAMPDAEAAHILAQHARGSLRPFLTVNDKTGLYEVDLAALHAKRHLHLIKKIKQKKRVRRTEDGVFATIEHDIEIHDPQAAADKIRRAHGAYGAKGTEEDPLHHKHEINYADLSDEQLRRLADGEHPENVLRDAGEGAP